MAEKQLRDEMLKVLIRMQKYVHRANGAGTMPQALFHVLHLIYHNGTRVSMENHLVITYEVSELAKTLKVSKPAISKVLRECEAKGYCKKSNMSEDKRKSVVILEEKGIQLCQQVDAIMMQKMDEMIDSLGVDDTLEFIRIMNRLQDILNDMFKKGRKAYDEIEEIS